MGATAREASAYFLSLFHSVFHFYFSGCYFSMLRILRRFMSISSSQNKSIIFLSCGVEFEKPFNFNLILNVHLTRLEHRT